MVGDVIFFTKWFEVEANVMIFETRLVQKAMDRIQLIRPKLLTVELDGSFIHIRGKGI